MKKLNLSFQVLSLPLALTVMGCAHSSTSGSKATSAPTASAAIHKMAGCYLVDYSYVETEAIKKGYKRDSRVYDVNKTKAVKEWIYAEDISPNRVRLQHILFAADAQGNVVAGSELKHQAEDWEYEAPFLYEFKGPSEWVVAQQPAGSKAWTRRITNLDDGLRYQCASKWNTDGAYAEWSCDNYAPIPGRETRDMSRKDYNTLQRSTRIVVYGDSWLERQDNIKTIDSKGKTTQLVKEAGKNWYVRLPESDCKVAKDFAESRKAFWALLRESWDDVYSEGRPFIEKDIKPPRYAKMMEIEATYAQKDLRDEKIRKEAREAILKVIQDYREPAKTSAQF